jgi:two-component system, chemotaxis family, chemotaxis protein CheY
VSSRDQPIDARPIRVLFVDDEPAVREIAALWLHAAGFDVVTAADGVSALRHFDAARFDVVVTDIFMPEVDGIELIQDLRRRRPELPVVAISGGGTYRDNSALIVASSLGADAALLKPFDCGELVAVIRHAVGAG